MFYNNIVVSKATGFQISHLVNLLLITGALKCPYVNAEGSVPHRS